MKEIFLTLFQIKRNEVGKVGPYLRSGNEIKETDLCAVKYRDPDSNAESLGFIFTGDTIEENSSDTVYDAMGRQLGEIDFDYCYNSGKYFHIFRLRESRTYSAHLVDTDPNARC